MRRSRSDFRIMLSWHVCWSFCAWVDEASGATTSWSFWVASCLCKDRNWAFNLAIWSFSERLSSKWGVFVVGAFSLASACSIFDMDDSPSFILKNAFVTGRVVTGSIMFQEWSFQMRQLPCRATALLRTRDHHLLIIDFWQVDRRFLRSSRFSDVWDVTSTSRLGIERPRI